MKSTQFLNYLSLLTHAMFTGSCIVVLFVLVPFWQSVPVDQFLSWFSLNAKNIGITMLPLEVVPLLLTLILFCIGYRNKDKNYFLLLSILLIDLMILIMFFIYFKPVNTSMALGTIKLEQVKAELITWQMYHVVRIFLSSVSSVLCCFVIVFNNRKSNFK